MAINDGGPAYPLPVGNEHCRSRFDSGYGGMSLRDAFAIAALQGLCANPGGPFQQNGYSGWGIVNCTTDQIAEEAYGLADAMIRARTQDASHE